MLSRDFETIVASPVGSQFDRIKLRIDTLKVRQDSTGVPVDSLLIRRTIDDVKYYFQTLTGERKEGFKDRFSIETGVLRERLSSLDLLIDAIITAQMDQNKEVEIIKCYESVKRNINFGKLPTSNLKNSLSNSLTLFGRSEYDFPIPERLVCIITGCIMFEPIIASDGHCYEKEALKNWIAKKIADGEKPTSPKTREILSDIFIRNLEKLNEIDAFLKQFPHLKKDQYVPIQTSKISGLTHS